MTIFILFCYFGATKLRKGFVLASLLWIMRWIRRKSLEEAAISDGFCLQSSYPLSTEQILWNVRFIPAYWSVSYYARFSSHVQARLRLPCVARVLRNIIWNWSVRIYGYFATESFNSMDLEESELETDDANKLTLIDKWVGQRIYTSDLDLRSRSPSLEEIEVNVKCWW